MTAEPTIIAGLAEVADRYDAFILDLWGTIHDGVKPLPGAVDCLYALKAAGKQMLILSNAPRRVPAVVDRMDAVGIPRDAYDDVLSSGEAAWLALHQRTDTWHAALGRRCFLIGEAGDESVLQDQDLTEVEDPGSADFAVAVGLFKRTDTLADYEGLLRDMRALNLPMICANPDLEVMRGEKRELCAGSLAARYEELGGEVHYQGKPHPPIYSLSFARLGVHGPDRILAVGDSLRTDVAGARAVGMDSLFIASGLMADELGMTPFAEPDPNALGQLFSRHSAWPTYTATAFRW
ncbi:MAG: TIGR01459 family HAD-type hydrolase [Bauldia litoralis]